MPKDPRVKLQYELTKADFDEHPLWTWWDSDEDEAYWIECDADFAEEAEDALWAACSFTLHDGTALPGVIGFRERDMSPYLVEFWKPDGTSLGATLNPAGRETFPIEQIETLLGRNRTDIFPLIYETVCKFGDTPLRGQIERDVYPQWLFPELKKWFDDRK